LIAFIADVKLVANMWLRSGDTSSSTNFLSFLEDTLAKLKNIRDDKKVINNKSTTLTSAIL
jgi:hypothetical protein